MEYISILSFSTHIKQINIYLLYHRHIYLSMFIYVFLFFFDVHICLNIKRLFRCMFSYNQKFIKRILVNSFSICYLILLDGFRLIFFKTKCRYIYITKNEHFFFLYIILYGVLRKHYTFILYYVCTKNTYSTLLIYQSYILYRIGFKFIF